MIHIRGHVRRVQAYPLAKDREGMTPEEVAQSEARVARVKAATGRHAKAHLKAMLSPSYQPGSRIAPKGVLDILRKRSEERRVGKASASPCRSRGSPYH